MRHADETFVKRNALTLSRDPDFNLSVFMRNLFVGHPTSDQPQLATDFVNREKIFSNEVTVTKLQSSGIFST